MVQPAQGARGWLRASLLCAALAVGGLSTNGALAQALRPEVAKPLSQASAALKGGRAAEALAKVKEADAVGNKTAAEQLMIERMRAAAAQRAGEWGTAVAALQAVFSRVGGGEQGTVAEQIASAYATMRNNAQAQSWVDKAKSLGNNSASLRQLEGYLKGNSGDFAAIARESAAKVQGAEQAGRRPDEDDLLRLADAQMRIGNTAGQLLTLEKLAAYHPKREYWSAYLGRLQRKPGFSERLHIDVLRLKLATGNLSTPAEYMELAQLALQAGLPNEGLAVVDKGFAAGALGSGAEAERHQRLKVLAQKRQEDARAKLDDMAAKAGVVKDGNDLVAAGSTYVDFGQAERGAQMIEQGIAKGGLKRPEDSKLRLGLALLHAKNKARATQVLRGLGGNDGTAEVGRAYLMTGG